MIARTTKFVPPAKSGGLISTILLKLDAEELTGKLVKFETESNGKEEQLVGNSDEQRYCKIVIVQGMDFGHDGAALVEEDECNVPLCRLSRKD